MSAKNRADLINKLFKYAKKNYSFIKPANRGVLEHLIYGCCLENSTFEAADEAMGRLQENFFDWNEVRVTTVAELAESCKGVSVPEETAKSIKKTLHGVFEKYYTYDLEFLKKENLSRAVQTFERFKGVSPFVISYVAQNGLSGHSIPLDRAMMRLFYTIGIVSEDEADSRKVSGLERTIPKAKGVEFFVLTHQLAAEFEAGMFKPTVRDKVAKLGTDSKSRLPKRGMKKTDPIKEVIPPPPPEEPPVEVETKPQKAAKSTKATKKKKVVEKKVTKTEKVVKKTTTKKAPAKKAAVK
ncbi:MAG: hypothetical protein AAF623_11045 [Planctomycetota bacterium]